MDVVVYNSLGAQDDAASATGSLHAKATDIKNTLVANRNQIKSWQRVTGSSESNYVLTLSLSTVNPSKCMVTIDGGRFAEWYNEGVAGAYAFIPNYISAFSANSISLSPSGGFGSGGSSGHIIINNGTVSVVVIEFY